MMVSSKSVTSASIPKVVLLDEVRQRPKPATVSQALGRLRVALDDAYLRASREQGLTAQQAELLCAALAPLSVGELARTLRCDQSNVTRLVDRASRHGLLRRSRDRSDARITRIQLSARGRRIAERFIASLEQQLAELLAVWPAQRQTETVAALNEIADALDGERPVAA